MEQSTKETITAIIIVIIFIAISWNWLDNSIAKQEQEEFSNRLKLQYCIETGDCYLR